MAKVPTSEKATSGAPKGLGLLARTGAVKSGKPVKPRAGKPGKPARPNVFSRLAKYFGDVRAEMRRVVWPTRQEVTNASVVVIVTLAGFTVFTGVADYLSAYVFIDILGSIGR